MCGMSNSSVDPRIRYDINDDDAVVLDTNISLTKFKTQERGLLKSHH